MDTIQDWHTPIIFWVLFLLRGWPSSQRVNDVVYLAKVGF
jgi:hypothetical protein